VGRGVGGVFGGACDGWVGGVGCFGGWGGGGVGGCWCCWGGGGGLICMKKELHLAPRGEKHAIGVWTQEDVYNQGKKRGSGARRRGKAELSLSQKKNEKKKDLACRRTDASPSIEDLGPRQRLRGVRHIPAM